MWKLVEQPMQVVDSESSVEPEVTISLSDQQTRRKAGCRGEQVRAAIHEDKLRPRKTNWIPLLSFTMPNLCAVGELLDELAPITMELHTYLAQGSETPREEQTWHTQRQAADEQQLSEHKKYDFFTSTFWISHRMSLMAIQNHTGKRTLENIVPSWLS